jgi:predicted membrane metal-binding protein
VVFACAVPASFVVWLVMNSIWFNRRRNYLIISLLMWSTLALIYIPVLLFAGKNLWLIFSLGLPGQAIIIMWSRLKQNNQ